MTYDASNRKSIRRAEKAAKLAEGNRIAFLRASMASLGGREYIYNLFQSYSIFRTPFVRGDAHATAFNCGQQNVILSLFADIIAHCPNEYLLMMQEAATKEDANDRRNSDDASTASLEPSDDATRSGALNRWDDSGPDDGSDSSEGVGAYVDDTGLVVYDNPRRR